MEKDIAKVVVGSRLHRLDNEDSDWDYRGIHISPLRDVISPFKKIKNTNWIDDYFGNHHYGVQFMDEDEILDPRKVKLEIREPYKPAVDNNIDSRFNPGNPGWMDRHGYKRKRDRIKYLNGKIFATNIFILRINDYYSERDIETPDHIWEICNSLINDYEKELKDLTK